MVDLFDDGVDRNDKQKAVQEMEDVLSDWRDVEDPPSWMRRAISRMEARIERKREQLEDSGDDDGG